MSRRVVWVFFALVLHAGLLARVAWPPGGASHGADFASYYYGARVAYQGGDPYDTAALTQAARSDGARKRVNPYLYPPPFLLAMGWTTGLDPAQAQAVWWGLNELFLLVVVWALWRWWRPLDPRVPWVVVLLAAALGAVASNAHMGQANLLVLALAIVGLWQQDRGRMALGGALVGVACVFKMAPALLVAWMLLRGRRRAVWAAVAAAVGLQGVALLVFDPAASRTFYFDVLPALSAGDYNGLRVPIHLWANHSMADLMHRALPAAEGARGLSVAAQWATRAAAVGLIVGLGWLFRRAPSDALQRAAQVGAVAIAMLLVPVFTFEHHLVWGLPAAVVLAVATLNGRLPRWSAPLVLAALAVWLVPRDTLRWVASHVPEGPPSVLLRELKFASLLCMGSLCALLGRGQR